MNSADPHSESVLGEWPDEQRSRLDGFTVSGGQSLIRTSSTAWWLEGNPSCTIVWRLTGIADSRLAAGSAGEGTLCHVEHPMLAEGGTWQSIFGQAPLPDPYRFFLEFQRAVRDRLSMSRDPVEYLNLPTSLASWVELVYGRSFLLLTAPLPVVEAALPLLDAQSMPHLPLPAANPLWAAAPPKIFFCCGRSWVLASEIQVQSIDFENQVT